MSKDKVPKKNSKLKKFKERIPGKVQGLRLWFRKKRQAFVRKFVNNNEAIAVYRAVLTIIFDGLLISGLVYPLMGFDLSLVIPFGAGWYFLKTQLLRELRQLISSLNLVNIGK
ncbi:MAG: hypothetical protein ACOC5T_08580 [Elusimicrobiota bacterium]